ncbi:MAG: aminoglycoside phosphotransferase family protein [Acidimicrobiales bacterium]
MTIAVPDGLDWLAGEPGGAAWLAGLPRLIDDIADRWDLDVGEAYPLSNVSFVAPARQRQQWVVLKVQWPHPECTHEAAALRAMDGGAAVRLLDHDPDRHALLLERCDPGTHLAAEGQQTALTVIADLLPRGWISPPGPFCSLADEATRWAATLRADWEAADRPCEQRLVDAALDYIDQLVPTQGEQVLLHQDLHGLNVIAAQRQPWLVIDPKPLVGERELALAPVIRSFELGHSRQDVVGRLDHLTDALGLDRGRVIGWAVAQTMAWSFGSKYTPLRHQTVDWLLEL